MDLMRAGQRAFMKVHVAIYRASKGRVLGRTFKAENVLVTTIGRKSGLPRVTPLVATPDGDRLVLVASNGGAAKHPSWYLNLVAHPEVTVQRGATVTPMFARVVTGDERSALWQKVVATYKGYEGYQRKTEREIPLVVLERR